ncbi:unnamed protein product [Adineta ricciae]|uniref:Peptidase S1 domain-containing protein n=1 Tax=Adineta ricciae TaxID=249248 RepID=A0A815TEM4_ADIRI|nr:unnamed protein product [Adineta ricciae]
MTRLCTFVLLLLSGLFAQNSIQASLYSCNRTASCGCSQNPVNINSRIVGGETASSHSWGWAVSIRRSTTRHFCGGSIISPNYILTAAHCVDGISLLRTDLTIAVGSDNLLDNEGQRILVAQIFMYSGYNSLTKENDIAILRLKKAISFRDRNIARICLPPASDLDATVFPQINSTLVAIGWGHTSMSGSLSNTLQQVTVNAVGNRESKCRNSIHNVDLQFCAAVNGGGKDTCQGDSGGPLMFFSNENQQWMLAGVTSYGRGCGLTDYAGVYTRASAYTKWIVSMVGDDINFEGNSAQMNTVSNIFYSGILALIILTHSFL